MQVLATENIRLKMAGIAYVIMYYYTFEGGGNIYFVSLFGAKMGFV